MLSESQIEILKTRSLLSMIFSESDWPAVFARLEYFEAESGGVFVNEGHPPAFTFIPLDGEVRLFSTHNNADVPNGSAQAGRTINTYAILRKINYQYSARFASQGSYCRLPTSLIYEKLDSNPRLLSYLMAMTEDHDLRLLAKDLDSLGCSLKFKVHFISSLVKRKCIPQERVGTPNETANEAIYLLEGHLVVQRSESGKSPGALRWEVPARTWVAWKNVLERTAPKHLVKAVSNAKVISLSVERFEYLQQNFPDDMRTYTESILSGKERADADDIEGEEVDLDEVMQNRPKVRRAFWQRHPWVEQSDQMDCAPACMAMISEHYDHKLSLQFWRSQLSTNREGTTLFDLAKTSERCGFTAYALEVEDLDTLDRKFFPAIVLRQYHYMVVYELTKTHVILGDPGLGIVKMPKSEFYDGFEKAILFLNPNEAFFSIPETTKPYAHFFGMLKGLEREIGLNFVVSLMIVALGVFTPIMSQIFLDDILIRKDEHLLMLALGASALIAILGGFLSFARVYYANYLAVKFDFKAHSVFIKKMLSLNYKFFADRHVGDFIKRLDEMTKIKAFLVDSVESIILSALSLVIYTAALFIYSPTIALVVFATTPVFFLISWLSGKKLTSLYQIIFKETAEIDSSITDTVKGIATIKALGAELSSRWRYEEKFVGVLKAQRNFALTSASIGVFAQFYAHLANACIMGVSAYMAIRGDLSPGQVVAVTMLAGSVLSPIVKLADQIGNIFEIRAVFNRLNDVMLAPSEKGNNSGRVKKETLRGEIEFRDVWFRYGGEGSDWVLKGLSFKIEAGQNVAFVGPSGSGKSTIASLITRMFVPTKGQIFIDGRDYLDYDIDWLRAKLGILHQDNHLFQGSILENIGYSEPEMKFSKVVESAKLAAAHEFIMKKPNEYGYLISAGGFGLSGGEKQRIALARTFYRDPKILILDEATSALDGIAETKLLTNLKRGAKGVTTINIAHRYSTVKHSDFALVIFEGRVVGFGTHEDLSSDNDIYQRLFNGRALDESAIELDDSETDSDREVA